MGQDTSSKGLALALAGSLLLTPDTLLMRLSGLGAVEMLAWRGLGACAALVTFWTVTSVARRTDLAALCSGAGLLTVALQASNAVLFVVGVAMAPVSVVLFGVATTPVAAAILGAIFLNDRVGRPTAIASGLVLFGIGLSVFSGGHGSDAGSPLVGALAGGAVALSLAGGFTVYRARPGLPTALTVGLGCGIAGAMGYVLSPDLSVTGVPLAAIATTGLVIVPASFLMLSRASRHTTGANVSLCLLLETVIGPILVWIGIGERVPPLGLVGGVIVVVTLAVYLDRQRRQARGS